MSDRPISDSTLSIVREMCDTVHPDIQLPTFIVKEMIARIDRWEAQPKTLMMLWRPPSDIWPRRRKRSIWQ